MIAKFLFIGSLNDFLSPNQKEKTIEVVFSGNPGIKDIIESLGVPHVEIKLIKVNSIPVDFSYHIRNADEVEIFPFSSGILPSETERPSFVLDVHLGKLARYLRMMGFDSIYRNDFSDRELVTISCREKRILLTRDIGVLKYGCLKHGYWIRTTVVLEQVKEVVSYYNLCPSVLPFSLCMECNSPLLEVSKVQIEEKIPPLTRMYYDSFSQCVNCKKVYWRGSHYNRMYNLLKQICPQLN
jgi:uncharacterized protein with PIN domain